MDFVTIDVETSNADMSTICQIGIVSYENGSIVDEWSSLIDPEDYFDDMNVSIHGIEEKDVENAPVFKEVYETVKQKLQNKTCVSHTHFDRVSLDKAIRKSGLSSFDLKWLDSAKVARRAWNEFASKGYGLSNVCQKIGFEFKHHDALEDAKACGAIILAAASETGLDLDGLITRIGQPIDGIAYSDKINQDGNPDGILYGQSLVFTGSLAIPRKDAAALAAQIGCNVTSGVNKKTDYLVVGDQDVSRLAGKAKSSKHIKAEQLILKGQEIRILKETDFKDLVANSKEFA